LQKFSDFCFQQKKIIMPFGVANANVRCIEDSQSSPEFPTEKDRIQRRNVRTVNLTLNQNFDLQKQLDAVGDYREFQQIQVPGDQRGLGR
jgi:hypothetical protein